MLHSHPLRYLLAVLLADLVSGLVHWAEDTFWNSRTPLLGRWVVRANELHHEDGTAFLRLSWWQSSFDLVLVSGVLLALAWWSGHLSGPIVLFALLSANANQIHKWSHMPRRQRPALVRALQRLRVLQSPAHHAGHHGGARNTRYCVMTELVNPVLDGLRLWRGLERLLATPDNAPRRVDLWGRPAQAGDDPRG